MFIPVRIFYIYVVLILTLLKFLYIVCKNERSLDLDATFCLGIFRQILVFGPYTLIGLQSLNLPNNFGTLFPLCFIIHTNLISFHFLITLVCTKPF